MGVNEQEKKIKHRRSARESARNQKIKRLTYDLSNFDTWYELNYVKGQNVKIPKLITFKDHIRTLCERDYQYELLLKDYNDLVDKYNELLENKNGRD